MVDMISPEYIIALPVAVTVGFFARLYIALVQKDDFLRSLYHRHHDLWERLGRPRGWRWKPTSPNETTEKWGFDRNWYSEIPPWLAEIPELTGLFLSIRKGFRLWNYIGMPVMLVMWIVTFFILAVTR